MDFEYWLIYDENEKLQLPVPPASAENATGLNNTTANINDIGEINLIGKRKLNSISIDTFFPKQNYDFCQYKTSENPRDDFSPSPKECIAMIEKWRDSGKPIRILITGTNINMPCSIEEFKYKTADGVRDVYFSLSLKEYRYLTAPTIDVPTPTVIVTAMKIKQLKSRPKLKTIPKEYVVKNTNETTITVSKKIYGTDTYALKISMVNKLCNSGIYMGILPIGQKLVLV